VINSKTFAAIGGYIGDSLKHCEEYSISNKWSILPSMNKGHYYGTAIFLNNKLYEV
jgi:hypothetical protein